MNRTEILADLHMHTTASDGAHSPKEMYEQALALNLNAIAITDHNSVDGSIALQEELGDTDPGLELIPGVELSYLQGHYLLLGIENRKMQRQLEKWQLTKGSYLVNVSYQQMRDALQWSADEGGLNIAAHPCVPFRIMSIDYEHLLEYYQAGLLHGAEIHNADLQRYFPFLYYPLWQTPTEKIVTEFGIPAYAHSDAHYKEHVGRYHNVFQVDASGRRPLTDILKTRPQQPEAVGFSYTELR